MDLTESARDMVERVLKEGGIRCATMLTERDYKNGICYVLLGPWDVINPGEEVIVIAAVNVGTKPNVLDRYLTKISRVLSDAKITIVGWTPAFGGPPLPGREMPPADTARITIKTGRRRPTPRNTTESE